MISQILPRLGDNRYRGRRLALWILGLIVLVKGAMSVNSIFNGRLVASNADGIPLDSFTPAGAQAVVSLFAIWGLAHLMICGLCILVLVRYRSLVPLMLTLVLLEHASRKLIIYYLPIVKVGHPPGFAVNVGLFVLEIAGLALALRWRESPPAEG